jgi:hypothetical protein
MQELYRCGASLWQHRSPLPKYWAKSGIQLLDEKTVLALFQRMLHKYNGNAVDSDHVTRYRRSRIPPLTLVNSTYSAALVFPATDPACMLLTIGPSDFLSRLHCYSSTAASKSVLVSFEPRLNDASPRSPWISRMFPQNQSQLPHPK